MAGQDEEWKAFATLFERSGLVLPDERLPVLFACYRQVRSWSDTMRAWQNARSDEPANAYSVASITRVDEAVR
jgi:hypothetical protein